jgi:hypothetical protein
MISSPTPTQQPPGGQPDQTPKKVTSTPRRRAGQAPAAMFTKGLLRPIFKGLYYLISAIRRHKLVTFIAIVLILASATIVTYTQTGQWPLGIGYDQFNFQVHGSNVGGDQVRNWLYALRDGDELTLSVLDRFMSSPPDPGTLDSTFSEPKAHLTWKAINVLGYRAESDTTVDSYVEVDLSTNGPGGPNSAFAFFHFTTATLSGGPEIIGVNVEATRGSLT